MYTMSSVMLSSNCAASCVTRLLILLRLGKLEKGAVKKLDLFLKNTLVNLDRVVRTLFSFLIFIAYGMNHNLKKLLYK